MFRRTHADHHEGHERAQLPLGAWCVAMSYRGRRGKSRGCFVLDKEGITQCNRKKKEKRPIVRKGGLLEKKKKKE